MKRTIGLAMQSFSYFGGISALVGIAYFGYQTIRYHLLLAEPPPAPIGSASPIWKAVDLGVSALNNANQATNAIAEGISKGLTLAFVVLLVLSVACYFLSRRLTA